MARCFAVLGASNTGKSTLVDRMCALEGKPPAAAPPGEMRIAPFSHLDESWTALDCPGSIDFLQPALDALTAADAAVICVAPDPAQAVLAAPYLRAVEAAGTPTIIFINRIDEAEGRVRDIVAALQDYANHAIVLRQIPIRQEGTVVGSVDLVSERAWKYREGEHSALIEIPGDVKEREEEARAELLESLSEYDDWLLEEIIEDRTPADGPVFSICSRVLQENRAMPALIGSAGHGSGIVRVMKALRHEAPDASALRDRLVADTASSTPIIAAAFHATHKRHVGKAVYLRALQAIDPSKPIGGRPAGQITAAGPDGGSGALGSVEAGQVVVAVKSDHLFAPRLCAESKLLDPPDWCKPLPPMLFRILEPVNERDSAKLTGALSTLAESDPSLSVGQDPETGAALAGTQGTLHLRVLKQRLADTFGIEVHEVVPPGTYRETITRKSDTHYRHKKQSGGAGQFADVKLLVAPARRGSGFSFSDTVKGGTVPRNYIPAVEAGARDAMERGPLGFPVVDVSVNLHDGLHHSVDSSDMAFRIAGRMGVKEALASGVPVLLQPFYLIQIHIPSIFTGALGQLISTHRGQVLGYDRDPKAKGWDVFRATVPGSALDALVGEIRSVTQGVGYFEAEFERYEELYGKEAEKVSEARLQELAGA
ncbi:MAG: elongation factor G [Paracoccaceae bacterium]